MRKRTRTTEPKRTRTTEVQRTRTRRTRTKEPEGELLVCSNHKCWYHGTCTHKKPHVWNPSCETTFCSMIKIRCGCIPVEEKEEGND